MRVLIFVVQGAVTLSLCSASAAAQVSLASGADDIVVTADVQAKAAEVGPLGTLKILDTPYAINSFTSDTIELRQTRTLMANVIGAGCISVFCRSAPRAS